MKKVLLACSMIMIVHMSFSQTIQLTNGGSTTTSGANEAAPVSAYFEYMRFQVIYTAAELNAAGITGPKSITQLGWYIATAPAAALPSYTIRMGHTAATNSAAHSAATLIEVYNVASYAPTAGGFDMLTLNGSFIWNGTDNLLVDVCYGAAPYVAPYGAVRTYAATTTSGSRRVRCDGCGSQCANNTNTTNIFKPQVSLTFVNPPSCIAPTGLGASSITSNSATVSWGAVAGATGGYQYAVTTSATPPASGTATGSTSVPVGSLSAATTYYLHVRSDCSGSFSSWSTFSFTTSCNSTTVPYSQNFDAVTAPAIPSCLTVENVNGNSAWGNYSTPSTIIIGTPNSMVYPYNSSSAADDWFFLQGLNLTGGTSYRLTFSWKSNPSFPERFEIRYGTGASAAGMTSSAIYTNTNAASSTAVVENVDFTPASTGVYYIGFHCNSLADMDFLAIDDITVDLSPSCVAPSGLAAVVTGGGTSANVSWNAVGGSPAGYEWAVTTSATPPASGTATTGLSATANSLTPGTQYYLHVRTDCGGPFSSWATFAFSTLVNDFVCSAIPLTLGGPQECANTVLATSSGDPVLPGGCSLPNNTVWYTYTPAASGPVTIHMEIPSATSNALNGWVAIYTATGTCPALTLTPVAGSTCLEFGQSGAGDIDDLLTVSLTGGTTYYIMIDGFSGDAGDFCINLLPPPAPPACVTNLTPANGATNVAITPNTPITWNASPGATSYNVFFGTTNPPTTNIGSVTTTNADVTGLAYSTQYYWYVQPVGAGGPATGCDVNTTSFTTAAAPVNCVPLNGGPGLGCEDGDQITLFRLKGEAGIELTSVTGTDCNAAGYLDSTDHATTVQLARGKTYWGQVQCGFGNNYITVWIDFDDDGYFENNERLIDNLLIGTTLTGFNLFVPLGSPAGVHRMRIRDVYYSSAPTTVTDPCGLYSYGETEDYNVEIVVGGTPYQVSTYASVGACYTGGGAITINTESNNNAGFVPIVDSVNRLIAQLYPQGNNLGRVEASYYKHNGAVRQSGTTYYLDRNLTITVATQPTGPYNLRFPYLNSELNALIAQPGSGVTSQFDLNMTKNGDPCLTAIDPVGASSLHPPTGFGSISGDRFLDFTNLNGFSSFYLHGGIVALPVNLVSFSGQRDGTVNKLRWTTGSEQYNLGFEVQRSADGTNYTAIGFVNSLATGGSSSTDLNYSFVDNNVQGKRWLYRLRQVNTDQSSKLSNIVIINGNKPMTLAIAGVFPNPTSDQINVLVDAPVRDNVQLIILDASGRRVAQKTAVIEAGSNTVPIPVNSLANGTYMVKLICSSNCETAVGRFVKQ